MLHHGPGHALLNKNIKLVIKRFFLVQAYRGKNDKPSSLLLVKNIINYISHRMSLNHLTRNGRVG